MWAHPIEEAAGELCHDQRSGQSEHHGDCRKHHALAHNQPLHGAALRAKRETDAHLPSAARYGITHDAVEADHGEHQADNAEDAEERATEAWKEERAAEMLLDCLGVIYCHRRVESMDLAPDGVRGCRGVALVVDDQLISEEGRVTAGALCKRAEENRPRIFADAARLDVLHHADDLVIDTGSADMLANGILSVEDLRDECLVDDADLLPGG